MARDNSMPPKGSPEWIELEFKRLQVELMQEQINDRRDVKARLEADRERAVKDFRKSAQELAHRQRICQHRKGGKNNNFAKGNSADYSIVQNTYPDGRICISCTRCGKEVWRPDVSLRKQDPKAYQEQWTEWQKWSSLPTDNTPSGSKIFEIVRDAA